MRLHTLKTFLAVLASLFHLSYTAILQERFRDWENTNSILSKADQFSVTKKQNYFDNNERTFREKESEDDEVVSEHINKEYLSDNYVKHGSKAEMDSPHGVNFHKYGSKFDKDTSDKKYDTDKLTIDKDIEQRFKKLVGAEDLPVPANKLSKRYKPSRYIKELFSAMLENDVLNPHAAEPSTETPIPTIRSYRGIRGNESQFWLY